MQHNSSKSRDEYKGLSATQHVIVSRAVHASSTHTSRFNTSTAVESSSIAWCKSSRLTFFGIFIFAATTLLSFDGTNLRPLYVPTVPPDACSPLLNAEVLASAVANMVNEGYITQLSAHKLAAKSSRRACVMNGSRENRPRYRTEPLFKLQSTTFSAKTPQRRGSNKPSLAR